MKILLFYLTLLTLTGCLKISIPGNNSDSKTTENKAECPEQPSQILSNKNVENIVLTNELLEQSGQVNAKKMIGYTFNATSGQEFTYETNDDICVWLYAPDTKLITDNKLTQTGKYIVQIGTIKGSKSFNINLGLDVQKIANSTPQSTPKPTIKAFYRPAPDVFVREHYIALNNRQYQETWDHLSPKFQSVAVSYSEYQKWWNSVNKIIIGDIKIVQQNTDTAIINADLSYQKYNNKPPVKDEKSNIHLIWSNQTNSWLLDSKSKP